MPINLPSKDPDDVEPFFVIWCSKDGTNANTDADTGELKGATISTTAWTVPSGITEDSNNKAAVTIKGVSYGINTVATIWLSGGTAGAEYELTNKITTSDSRTLSQSITIEVKEH
jgi:hypothetical protein